MQANPKRAAGTWTFRLRVPTASACGALARATPSRQTTSALALAAIPLYEDFIDVYFCGLKILECNGKSPMKGRADYAILRRVIVRLEAGLFESKIRIRYACVHLGGGYKGDI
jgi:hypothetical protein